MLFAVLILVGSASAQWAQWRGPGRDGVVQGFEIPEVWPEQLNLIWKEKVGYGHASPVAEGGAVYTFTREKDDEIVTKLELSTGKKIWRQKYEAISTLDWYGSGNHPKSTPAVSDGRLVTFGITGVLTCWDLESGDALWRHTFEDEFETPYPAFGAAVSPLVVDGKIYVHVGGKESGAFRCLSLESGETIWSWGGDSPAYASPVLMATGSEPLVVTQSMKFLVGLEAGTGVEAWRIPFETAQEQNTITALIRGDEVIYSGYQAGTHAIRVSRDSAWHTDEVWSQKEISQYMGSPVLADDLLIGFDHKKKGRLFGMDPDTGEMLWVTHGRWGKTASIVLINDHIAVLSIDGQISFSPLSRDGHKTAAYYDVASTETWAHPAFAEGVIVIKDERHVSAWRF